MDPKGHSAAQVPHPLQAAFLEEQAGQCGYCLSGMLIASAALLKANPAPDEADVRVLLQEIILTSVQLQEYQVTSLQLQEFQQT